MVIGNMHDAGFYEVTNSMGALVELDMNFRL